MTPFGTWLADHGISYANAARALGVTRAYVQALAVGKATPKLDTLGTAIERWTASLDPAAPVAKKTWLPFSAAWRRFEKLKESA
jgi:hypothetical protein